MPGDENYLTYVLLGLVGFVIGMVFVNILGGTSTRRRRRRFRPGRSIASGRLAGSDGGIGASSSDRRHSDHDGGGGHSGFAADGSGSDGGGDGGGGD